jgi:hypothetical protein
VAPSNSSPESIAEGFAIGAEDDTDVAVPVDVVDVDVGEEDSAGVAVVPVADVELEVAVEVVARTPLPAMPGMAPDRPGPSRPGGAFTRLASIRGVTTVELSGAPTKTPDEGVELDTPDVALAGVVVVVAVVVVLVVGDVLVVVVVVGEVAMVCDVPAAEARARARALAAASKPLRTWA